MTTSPPTLHDRMDPTPRTAVVTGGAMGEPTERGLHALTTYADAGAPDDVRRLIETAIGRRGRLDVPAASC